MTDTELTDRIAVEVMEWRRICYDAVLATPGFDDNGFAWYREVGDERYVFTVSDFDPLHDHNHTALAREKMIKDGWQPKYVYGLAGEHYWTYWKWKRAVLCSECLRVKEKQVELQAVKKDKDMLKAEALAMLQALEKETSHD